jgi:Poly(hydroxyalcanoate) granule associated protein (phasin).
MPGAMAVASGLARRAREMWLAGLGALSVAEEASSQVFDALVEEGRSWEEKRREETRQTAEQVQELTEESSRTIEAVEQRVRDEVNEALQKLGVPHQDDVDELRDQLDALADRMDDLTAAIREEAGENE